MMDTLLRMSQTVLCLANLKNSRINFEEKIDLFLMEPFADSFVYPDKNVRQVCSKHDNNSWKNRDIYSSHTWHQISQ